VEKEIKTQMKNIKPHLFLFLFLLLFTPSLSFAQQDSALIKLTSFVEKVNSFSQYLPQEKVYVHMDNTDYFLGESIWFKCYVTNSELNKPSDVSKILYVELLSPNGDVVISNKYKIVNGQCHGDMFLDTKVIYSGFYELRAYTRYMTNFDAKCVFSRVIPIYSAPKDKGVYTEHKMIGNNTSRPSVREKKPERNDVDISFFPEGGNLIAGVESKIAFKATDNEGRFIDVTGIVYNEKKEAVAPFSSIHQGMGTFSLMSDGGKYSVEVQSMDKKSIMDLPASLPNGYVMRVDAITNDSIQIQVQKSNDLPGEIVGIVTMVRDKVYQFASLDFSQENVLSLSFSKAELPTGVGQVILFDTQGRILSDRPVFIEKKGTYLSIQGKMDKTSYSPLEKVSMDFSIQDGSGKPVETTFSLSVKDKATSLETAVKDNILVNMLLSSDIKGYIENPSYYFENVDRKHMQALDLLLMTQGWRRYQWKQMTGLEPKLMTQRVEKVLMIDGNVKSIVKKSPKPNMDLELILNKQDTAWAGANYTTGYCKTGLSGNFTFYIDMDINGKWNTVIQAKSKGKRKDTRIMLDRTFSPTPRAYTFFDTEMNVPIMNVKENDENPIAVIPESLEKAKVIEPVLDDTLDMTQRDHLLKELEVQAKRKQIESQEKLAEAVLVYDVEQENDKILDEGGEQYDNILSFMKQTNPFFLYYPNVKARQAVDSPSSSDPNDYYTYKNRPVMFLLDNKPIVETAWKSVDNISMTRIAKITICDEGSTPLTMFDETGAYSSDLSVDVRSSEANLLSIKERTSTNAENPNPSGFDRYGKIFSNVVYVFLYSRPNYKSVTPSKGLRLTSFEGYAVSREFYSSDYKYELLPDETDFRRTLYWNPNVATDKEGKASVSFYNNSTATDFSINAETMTRDGKFGVYKQE